MKAPLAQLSAAKEAAQAGARAEALAAELEERQREATVLRTELAEADRQVFVRRDVIPLRWLCGCEHNSDSRLGSIFLEAGLVAVDWQCVRFSACVWCTTH